MFGESTAKQLVCSTVVLQKNNNIKNRRYMQWLKVKQKKDYEILQARIEPKYPTWAP